MSKALFEVAQPKQNFENIITIIIIIIILTISRSTLRVSLGIYGILGFYGRLWVFIWVIMDMWLSMGIYGCV